MGCANGSLEGEQRWETNKQGVSVPPLPPSPATVQVVVVSAATYPAGSASFMALDLSELY